MTSPLGTSQMRFRSGAVGPALPTPPTGFAVAAYPTYAQAQEAIEHLAKNDFSIEDVTIVGTDLQMVERVTGRLTAGKLAGAGAASGAWFGLFVGLLMSFYGGTNAGFALIAVSVAIGAVFGAVMGYLGYSVAKGRRDFTSSSQVVARRYDVLCQPRTAEQARNLLARMELGGRV
ncbi:general stress protein [Nakamurella panacisegetis]|nr:general stress protein [Nakamurella panacisegetis]